MSLEKFIFYAPVRFDFGVGVSAKTGQELKNLGCKKAMIITDQGIVKAGIVDKIKKSLDSEGIGNVVYSSVKANPSIENAEEACKLYKNEKCDCLIGLGGGSCMDAAKAAGVVINNSRGAKDYADGNVENKIPPLITIPTNAGTGSELNAAAVITDSKNKVKFCIFNWDKCSPLMALSDPELTVSVPPKLTAYQGIDVLSHGIEAYTSKYATSITDAIALYTIDLVSNNLRQAYSKGYDLEARSNMLKASAFSGMAECNSWVGNAHAMSQSLGGYYDLPHGLLCGLFMPYVMEYNMLAAPQKFIILAKTLGENVDNLSVMDAAYKSVVAVKRLLSDLDMPTLKELGVKEADFQKLAEQSSVDNCAPGNIRTTSVDDFKELLERTYNNL
ncbi:Choline dehydrogenase [subsurface metagenome]